MEWIVKIETTEEQKKQQIKIIFDPMGELIHFQGECKIKNNRWIVFSEVQHNMSIDLSELQIIMGTVVVDMRKRLVEYENLDKGFSVLKEVGFEEEE